MPLSSSVYMSPTRPRTFEGLRGRQPEHSGHPACAVLLQRAQRPPRTCRTPAVAACSQARLVCLSPQIRCWTMIVWPGPPGRPPHSTWWTHTQHTRLTLCVHVRRPPPSLCVGQAHRPPYNLPPPPRASPRPPPSQQAERRRRPPHIARKAKKNGTRREHHTSHQQQQQRQQTARHVQQQCPRW